MSFVESNLKKRQIPRSKQRGFIITIELILITTILVIGSFVGIVAIRDALVKHYAQKQSREVYVSDASGIVLGQAVDYDEHEAPRIPYIDRTAPVDADGIQRNYRALIGVRDDRFTGREPVYYHGLNCTGTPCIKASSDERADSYDIAGDGAAGAVGYLYALQGGPTYAIGSAPSGVQGYLYRQGAQACPYTPDQIQSRYISQKVVPGIPCENVSASSGSASADTTATATSSDATAVTDAYTDCIVGAPIGGVLSSCSCPSGYNEQNDVISAADAEIQQSIDAGITATLGFVKGLQPYQVGTICCQDGYALDDTGLGDTIAYAVIEPALQDLALDARKLARTLEAVSAALPNQQTTFQCFAGTPPAEPPAEPPSESPSVERTLVLKLAEPVTTPDDATQNALAPFTAPFRVNLPTNVADDNWIYIPPDGEG